MIGLIIFFVGAVVFSAVALSLEKPLKPEKSSSLSIPLSRNKPDSKNPVVRTNKVRDEGKRS